MKPKGGKKVHHVRGNSDGIPNLQNIIPKDSIMFAGTGKKFQAHHHRISSGSSAGGSRGLPFGIK
jgi:hypothetical protein